SKLQAVNYLKNRGLDGKTAKAYGVGFAPPGWDNLLKALGQNDEDKHLLIEGGMLIHQEQEKKLYDRFRHRIMFPIRDTRGRVIGFGGRVLGDDKPKYLNSPETPVFHKGQELYGLYEARLAYRELPRLLVVEGYMDVVSLAQFGIGYGVATLGTACGPDHLDRAFKYTNEVVFCFDGDKAGRSAAHRALEASIDTMTDGRTVKFLFLPEGEDPDTLVRQIGPDKFERMIELAVPFEDYLFDAVAEGINIRTMEGRATFSKRAAPLLDRLPKGVFRELMFESLATRTGLNRNILQELIQEQQQKGEVQPLFTTPPAPQKQEESIPTLAMPKRMEQEWDHLPPAPPEYLDAEYGDFPQELPPADYHEFYEEPRLRREPGNKPHQPDLHNRANSKYLMPPVRKALALLLTHPTLASLEPNHDEWLAQDDDLDCQMLGRLLKVLHERPHYNLSHLIGYWRGIYGAENTERLAAVAGHDLLQAANAISQTRQDKPAKADYDTEAAFTHAMQKLRLQQTQKKAEESLAKLKNTNFNQLSKEERETLVRAALDKKLQH
ncbi:MAG TPA: toprim domain-containing protein, partial [Cellvibrio sp.]